MYLNGRKNIKKLRSILKNRLDKIYIFEDNLDVLTPLIVPKALKFKFNL